MYGVSVFGSLDRELVVQKSVLVRDANDGKIVSRPYSGLLSISPTFSIMGSNGHPFDAIRDQVSISIDVSWFRQQISFDS